MDNWGERWDRAERDDAQMRQESRRGKGGPKRSLGGSVGILIAAGARVHSGIFVAAIWSRSGKKKKKRSGCQ